MRLVVESGVLFQRALREIPRVPTRIAFPVIGPVMQLILLTAVLTNVTQLRGYPASSSVQFMTAGVLALTVLAGAGGAGFQMVQDIDTGFFDKLRVAPISRAAIVLGLLLTDATRLAVQSLVVLVIALLLGAHIATGVPGLIGILVLAAIFGMAWSGISLNVALRTRNPEVTAAAGVRTFITRTSSGRADAVVDVATSNPHANQARTRQGLALDIPRRAPLLGGWLCIVLARVPAPTALSTSA